MSATRGLPGFVAGLPAGPLIATGRALQARLATVFPLSVFQHGVVPANVNAKEWAKLTIKTPFIGIGWSQIDEKSAGGLFTGVGRWTIFLSVKNERGIAERYFGDRQAPGLFQLTQIAIAALHGMRVADAHGSGIGTLLVRRAANAHGESFDENQAIAVIDCDITTTIEPADAFPAPDDLGLFETLAPTWDFEARGGGEDVLSDTAAIPTTMESN